MEKHETKPDSPVYPSSHSVGLTKREYFASVALQGMLGNAESVYAYIDQAAVSVRIANRLIEELNKSPESETP